MSGASGVETHARTRKRLVRIAAGVGLLATIGAMAAALLATKPLEGLALAAAAGIVALAIAPIAKVLGRSLSEPNDAGATSPKQHDLRHAKSGDNRADSSPDDALIPELPDNLLNVDQIIEVVPEGTAWRGVLPKVVVGSDQNLQLALENYSDEPVTNVTLRYEDESGDLIDDFDLLANRPKRWEVLPPRSTVLSPLLRAWGSRTSAICIIKWTDQMGNEHETRTTIRTP